MAGAAVFGFADSFGSGGGDSTAGAAGVDGVGGRDVVRERELERRGLRQVRDGSRLRRNGAPRRIG